MKICVVVFSVLTVVIAMVGIDLMGEAVLFINNVLGIAELSALSRIGVGLFELSVMVLIMTTVVILLCEKIAELIE